MTLVSELKDAELDLWVAKAEGYYDPIVHEEECYVSPLEIERYKPYSPSTDWSQGGPIIEREDIAFGYRTNTGYAHAHILHREQNKSITQYGNTKLIAAMRCFVASTFGEEVPS